MVRVKVKVGEKGQIVIPKMLGIEPRKYVTIEMQEDRAVKEEYERACRVVGGKQEACRKGCFWI